MPHVTSDRQQVLADAALMEAVASGDERVFSRLMREEGPRLVRLSASLLGTRAEAEEVLQESFLRLWQAAPNWEPLARIGTWMHRVVYRLSIDRLRKRRPTVDVEDLEGALASGEATPEESVGERQQESQIAQALDQLSPRQRTAIVLAHYQGLSQAEACAVLELTEEAYESLLARARRRLKTLVSEMQEAPGAGAMEN